jgi:phosphate transport system substrate-binding protein
MKSVENAPANIAKVFSHSSTQEIKMRLSLIAAGVVAAFSVATAAQARDQISIVGSSTVYPFATIVAEKFGQLGSFKTPVIESTGTGGGMKLFCKGIGVEHPDITNASRAMKSSEADLCKKAGVDFQEFIVGNDGVAFANNRYATPNSNVNANARFDISIAHIAAALAKEIVVDGKVVENNLMTWADVDGYVAGLTKSDKVGLPALKIGVMVPPPTSGTRDAMGELFMKAGWKKLGLSKGPGKNAYKKLREDGGAIEMGENDNLIIEKLAADPALFGVFGYSFFDQNRDKVQASILDGVELNFDNIASYKYPGARPLFFYVKKQHIGVIPGMKEFIQEFVSEKAMGLDGYLFPAGLVPLSDDDFAKQVENRNSL